MNRSNDYTVQLVDDHHLMRVGLKAMAQTSSSLSIRWVESDNLGDALKAYALQRQVDLVLLDLHLPDSQGLQSVRRFMHSFPNAHVAIYSGTEDEFVVRQALALGAAGFVPKSAKADGTLRMIESLLLSANAGLPTQPMSLHQPSITAWPDLNTRQAVKNTAALSSTQLKVLELILDGLSNQEIATECQLAVGTVKNTVSSIMLSLDVHSRSHLISLFR